MILENASASTNTIIFNKLQSIMFSHLNNKQVAETSHTCVNSLEVNGLGLEKGRGERLQKYDIPLIIECWSDESIIMSTMYPSTMNQNTVGKTK